MTPPPEAPTDGGGDAGQVHTPAQSVPEPADGSEPRQPTLEEVQGLRAEARQHRMRARNAESERDQLRSRLETRERGDVERMVADRLENPGDLWLTTSVSDLKGDEGEIDHEKLDERLDQLLEQRPHWRKSERPQFHSGARRPVQRPKTLGEALKRSIGGG